MKITDLLGIFFSIPKTVYFNLRYLPVAQAVHLPIWLHYSVCIRKCKSGGVIVKGNMKPALIRIGFHTTPVMNPNDRTMISVEPDGIIVFQGSAHIGRGSKIAVHKNAELELGDNFAISSSTQINCYHSIKFGRDIQFSWDCLVMDSDTHKIYGENGECCNVNKPIVFGSKIWIGCRATILKGSVIPDNCVIGACSLVSGKRFEENSIIAGSPAKSTKKILGWKL